jgi:hypothetical protein
VDPQSGDAPAEPILLLRRYRTLPIVSVAVVMLAFVVLHVADDEAGVMHLGSPPLGGNRPYLRRFAMSAKLLTQSASARLRALWP